MFLDSNSLISRASRQLWPLPTFVIPSALGLCFIVPELFGSNLTELVIVLFVSQILVSANRLEKLERHARTTHRR